MGTELRTSREQHICVNRVDNGWIVKFSVFTNTGVSPGVLTDVCNWNDRRRVFDDPGDAADFVAHYLDADPVELATETEGLKLPA